jgi:hypothetical protein
MGLLGDRAIEIENYVCDHFIDPHNVLYSRLNIDTKKPWTSIDWNSNDEFLFFDGGHEPWDIINYENTGMVTGTFLCAMSYKYRVTGDSEVLKTARQTFEGLCQIYEMGKQVEEGFFPKPYGWRLSKHISTDQYLYVMMGLMAYRDIASEGHRRTITRMITQMVDFWFNRGYRYKYFGEDNWLWPVGRFGAFMIMAYTVSGERKYLDEFERLHREDAIYLPCCSQVDDRNKTPGHFTDYERSVGNKYLLSYTHEMAAMDITNFDVCLRYSDAYREQWLTSMKQAWNEGLLPLDQDGLVYWRILYDPETKAVSIPEAGFTGPEAPLGWDLLRWVGNMKMPRSTMLARVGGNVARWLPDEKPLSVIKKILSAVSLENCTDYISGGPGQILDKHLYQTKLICGDSLTNWLWAYWQGRFEGLFEE